MKEISENKPCLVQTGQGFSVEYKGKLLYSKYNPSKTIVQTIKGLTVLPQTLVLCVSPVLDYGINELLSKIKETSEGSRCIILENEEELFEFEKKRMG